MASDTDTNNTRFNVVVVLLLLPSVCTATKLGSEDKHNKFCYGVFGYRYIRFLLISDINFYYIINKLIILVLVLYYFSTYLSLKLPFNRHLTIFNY
jgi:hypothetical protein